MGHCWSRVSTFFFSSEASKGLSRQSQGKAKAKSRPFQGRSNRFPRGEKSFSNGWDRDYIWFGESLVKGGKFF